jgi:hypothetical protein
MGIVLPVIGQTSWGDEANACFEGLQDGGLVPSDAGFLSWNYSSQHISTTHAQTSGTVVMARLPRFTQSKTVNQIWMHVGAAAVTPTAGQCFAAIVRIDGTRMGVSADISGQLATPGLTGWNLTAGAVCAAGDYYVTLLQNAATPATLGSCSSQGSASAANAGLTAATAFHTTGPTAQTSIPASITMASRTLSGNPLWAGVK